MTKRRTKQTVIDKEGADAIADFVRQADDITAIAPEARAVIEQHHPELAGKLPRKSGPDPLLSRKTPSQGKPKSRRSPTKTHRWKGRDVPEKVR
jgi:hypothetical protein